MVEFSKEYEWLNRHLPLNFKIEPTDTRAEADFVIDRGDEYARAEKVIGALVMSRQDVLWPLQPEYRGKRPAEQWALTIGDHTVQFYNYVPWRRLSNEHAQTIVSALAKFEAAFPGSVQKLHAITAVDHLRRSPFGDLKKYPAHAESQPEAGMFAIQGPRALRLGDRYRNQLDVSSLQAVVIHEMTHLVGLDKLIAADFRDAGLTWSAVLTPIIRQQKVINGHFMFSADQPEACITDFGILDPEEDACESMAAYLYKVPQLHPLKERVISYYDFHSTVPECKVTEIRQPSYPLIPEHFSYYTEQ